jgi:membrane protease subunit HflC
MIGKLLLPVLILLVVIGWDCFFIVDQREYAIVLRFRDFHRSDLGSGLNVKAPYIDTVVRFDRRLLSVDEEGERFLTKEQKDVIVDSFAKWRITDVEAYYKATGGNQGKAIQLLSQKIKGTLRDEIAKRDMQSVIAGERGELMDIVTKEAQAQGRVLGVEVVDVRVKKINFPVEVSSSVHERMRSSRERDAKKLRSEGAQKAEQIRSDADRQRVVILAEAYRDAEKIKGNGDASAAEIYANAYQNNPEFYAFYRSLAAYRHSFGKGGDLLLLEPDSEFFNYFKRPSGQ